MIDQTPAQVETPVTPAPRTVWAMNRITHTPSAYTELIGVASTRQAAIDEMATHHHTTNQGWTDNETFSGQQYSYLRVDEVGYILEVRETRWVGAQPWSA